MDLERYRAAWAGNAVAKQTLEDQEKLALQDEGMVKADQGVVKYDEVQLAYCHITAPFAGRVGLRLVDPGNVVQANGASPLAVLTQEQPTTVIFTVAEDTLGVIQAQVRRGAQLTVDAYDRAAQTKIATRQTADPGQPDRSHHGNGQAAAIFETARASFSPISLSIPGCWCRRSRT